MLKPLRGQVTRYPEMANRIGYVPQRGQLDPLYPLTVFDVVRMSLTGSAPERAIVLTFLEKVKMAPHIDASYAALSGGQQQRVLIARALAVAPRVLVLDEPTSGVDAVAEQEIMDMLAELNTRDNLAIVLVSHKIPLLKRYAKKTLSLGQP